ncbi:MAG: cell division protein FtsW [Candidatus Liptonbacteria bacterium]|nr:cell division protein FtsW [Candidatus Liptonbacteria bacterium]
MARAKIHKRNPPDYVLLATLGLLVIVGLVILASASSDLGRNKFHDSFYYLKHQLLFGLSLGLLGFGLAYGIDYQFYRRFAAIFLIVSIVLLGLVFTPMGAEVGRHAARWIRLGSFTFQPAEVVKLTFLLYLAAWLANTKVNRERSFWDGLVPFAAVSGMVALLLILQPATSTVVILMAAAGVVYFVSGAHWRYMIGMVFLGVVALAAIIYATPYRRERVLTYLNPSRDTQNAAYHINQSLIAIGSGRVFGVGFGQSTSKISFLPAPMDDSIFAVAAEEFGFVGAGALVSLFGSLVFRTFWIAWRVRDRFGRLLLVGFGSIIAFQTLINIGAISGLLPLTGVPLPFISYGGTALAVFMTMVGFTANISRYTSA